MRRKRKPVKAVRSTPTGHRAFKTKGRQKTHLSRYINEEIE